jgi:hypothetical protein
LGEVTFRYGFHPHCGETVIVTGRNRHGDEVALTVRQPDGTLTQLPIWMTEDRAAAMIVTEVPRLSLACLRELRLELDALQSLLCDDSPREGDERTSWATIRWCSAYERGGVGTVELCRIRSRVIANPISSRSRIRWCR